jgi:anti-anti-sigma factor
MEGSTEESLVCDVAGDLVADSADHGFVGTDLEQGGRAEPALASLVVQLVDHPPGVVLTLRGELDLASVEALQEQLNRVMRGREAVAIDLSGLTFIDSSGLRMLVRAEQELRASGGRLVLVPGPRAVHRTFELTGLDSCFELCDSPDAALRTALERRNGPG